MANDAYKRFHGPTPNKYNAAGSLKKGTTKQGYYDVENTSKYIGDPNLVIYRSSWEEAFCKYCDNAPSVLRWSSEPVSIPYYDRVSKLEECAKLGLNPNDPSNWEVKNYNTDFWYESDLGQGEVEKIFVEIKPSYKLRKPIPPEHDAPLKQQRIFNNAAKEYLINEAKFAALKAWAEKNGSKFYVFTEITLEKILGRLWPGKK